MLAADKLQLQSAVRQQATALKEKEFNLHHSNMTTVGTIAAVLAGLDITMFIEFTPHEDSMWTEDMRPMVRILKFFYYTTIVAAFCANMIVVSQTTTLTVLGAGMALRGPDGSMMTATDGLYDERKSVFLYFAVGLANTVGSVTVGVWLILQWEAALCCMIIVLITCRIIWINYKRVKRRFNFDESDTVDFRDIMESGGRRRRSSRNRQNNKSNYSRYEPSSMEEGDSDEWSDGWQQSQRQAGSSNNDVKKRRGGSSNSGLAIQTI